VQIFVFKQQVNIYIFMITQVINMNTSLRMYPVEGRVMASLDIPISLESVILIIE
jgi:hypothetical protein